ncbi:hypothetical protein NDU88_000280 [Pleurodeles waltl]|uniref:Uncharacterized protein n=1 Tax=Pleurodeles waltl TaxID=8319 RepID=A0AAV7SWQ5_PLEWA|nr:hypothetical protein NDU88_000280 [Pleurodeles waltl]
MKVAEGSIAELQSEVGTLRSQVAQATSTVGRLEERLGDAEGRSRRNNIRLLGFWERAEGLAVESFVESWIKDVLQLVGLCRMFVVEHAHRALVAPPQPGAPPRAIFTRLLNYKEWDCILRTARESARVIYENCKISIYPDYTNKVQNSRKGFMEFKAKLRAMNIRFMLLYPAHLKVLSGGKSYFFERPEEVWRWLEMWDKVAPGRPEGSGGAPRRASGSGSPAWRSHGSGRLVETFHRVEIQRDGTMAVVPVDSDRGTVLECNLEVGGDAEIT